MRSGLGRVVLLACLGPAAAFQGPTPLWTRTEGKDGQRRAASVAAVSPQTPPEPAVLLELPKPLTPLERAARSVSFWTRVVPILMNYSMVQRRLDTIKEEQGEVDPQVAERMWEEAHEWGSQRLSETIMDLKGFYVKSGQVMSTRVDIFPQQYIERLQKLQDSLEPIPTELVKTVVRQELLEGEPLELLFSEFDPEPLGSASIAQVHRAVLVDGRQVAVKVQRPSEEPKLRGDVANLKLFAQRFRKQLPVDYYPVFSELEKALGNELDFLAEAQAIEKIAASVAHTADGKKAVPPVMVPRAVPGLVSKRVLVMDFVQGVPLNRLKEKMAERNITEGSAESVIFGTRLLTSLTEAFARMVFGPGFIHGDPHPGNIFVCEGGKVALLDCGQVKQLSNTQKLRLAGLILLVSRYDKPGGSTVTQIADKVREFGVELEEGAGDECAAALALLLFGDTVAELPGGYSTAELSSSSPLKQVKKFPQELVMLGRATVLLKGIASRLQVPWNLSEKWSEAAAMALECGDEGCSLPVYATVPLPKLGQGSSADTAGRPKFSEVRLAFRQVRSLLKAWMVGKIGESLPPRARAWVVARELRKIRKTDLRQQQRRQQQQQQEASEER